MPERAKPCTLMGCRNPEARHHHHYYRGHLDTLTCDCPWGGVPGSRGVTQEGAEK